VYGFGVQLSSVPCLGDATMCTKSKCPTPLCPLPR
jgi:hypothetical protein